MSGSIRLFIAIPLDAHYHNLLHDFTKQQQIRGIKWIEQENLHITVLFLGNFPQQQLELLKSRLGKFFRTIPSFALEYDKFAYIPSQVKPGMIWGRFRPNSYFDHLCRQLAGEMENLYSELGILFRLSLHAENIPHVTLCRLKNPYLRYPELNMKDINTAQPLLRCDFCILFQSVLSADGAKYINLAEYKLIQI
jgi:2'-5' RNA ligase